MSATEQPPDIIPAGPLRRPPVWAVLRDALPGVVASALSGLLLFLAFPRVDWGALAYVALVPLFVAACRAPSVFRTLAYGVVAAAFGFLPAFAWVASVAPSGWIVLAAYVGAYMVLAVVLIRVFQRRMRVLWPLLAAALWVALDFSRAHLGPGFPWLFIGYTQYRSAGLLQLAALGGVHVVGFVVVLVNASIASVVLALTERRWRLAGPVLVLSCTVILLLVAVVAGRHVRESLPVREGPVVGVVQQNFPRLVSEIYSTTRTQQDAYRLMAEEMQVAAQLSVGLRDHHVRLLCWPETTVQVPLNLSPELLVSPVREMVEQALGYIRTLAEDMDAYVLVGAPTYFARSAGYIRDLRYTVHATEDYGNSAVLFSPQGEFVDRYDKVRLVPFGEYVPWRDILPFLPWLTPIPREITPGAGPVIFRLSQRDGPPVPYGALICYEDVFPDLTREFRLLGARFFVNLTDEGWYVIPGEHGQHLAMAVFRAVETRTSVVRAANTGISCFIGPRGSVYEALPLNTRGALAAPVRLCDAVTPYVRFGDWFPASCLVVSILVPVLLGVVKRREE